MILFIKNGFETETAVLIRNRTDWWKSRTAQH